jgi:hypothetical protein
MVNSFIVDKCTPLNTEDRETHRGVEALIFSNLEVGKVHRVINFQCTSQSLDVAKIFCQGGQNKDKNKGKNKKYTLIHYKIPKGCWNACNIESFAIEAYKGEKETLLPAYTACRVLKKETNEERKEFWLEVTKDNRTADFKDYTC